MSSRSTFHRLCEIYQSSMEIPFDDSSKIVLISDCHRGDGSWVDDFTHNQNLYYCAIKYYYLNGFTYIDLGDSDELWKNRSFGDISSVYTDIFHLLHLFYAEKRFYMVYGNHDMEKKSPAFIEKNMRTYYDGHTDREEPLFEDITAHEGLILRHEETQQRLFLVHGHQGDLISDLFWRFGRLTTRYFWRRLEFFGLKDITSAAKNYEKERKVERKIKEWVTATHLPVIAGHTHRPACPSEEECPYFNDGSCVHPDCITCMEIERSTISLVKWDIKTREDRTVYVDRELIAVPRRIDSIGRGWKGPAESFPCS